MRILVGSGQAHLREALERLLATGGHDVVGRARDGPELERRARAERPELVIADEALHAARRIRAAAPGTATLLLSHELRVDCAVELLAGDAHGVGYLLRQRVADGQRFLAALETLRHGGTVVDAEVVAALSRSESLG